MLASIKPEISLETKMTNLRLTYLGHIMKRRDSLRKAIVLGKVQVRKKKRKTKYEVDGLEKGSPELTKSP